MAKVCSNIKKNYRIRVIGLGILVILAYSVLASAQEANLLRSILTVKAPVVRENKMIYTYNLLFKECPAGSWWYYDSSNRQIIIEFYDAYVNVAQNISIKGQMPVKEIEVRNVATSIVPSGKKTQVILHVKKQMQAEVNCFGDTMRVLLWKEVEKKAVQHRKKMSFFYINTHWCCCYSWSLNPLLPLFPGCQIVTG